MTHVRTTRVTADTRTIVAADEARATTIAEETMTGTGTPAAIMTVAGMEGIMRGVGMVAGIMTGDLTMIGGTEAHSSLLSGLVVLVKMSMP